MGVGEAFAQQQGLTYTQYMDNQTPINAAYSLLDKSASISFLGRKKYVGISGSPTSLVFNGSLPFESVNAAAGLVVLSDKVAIENNTEVSAFFAKSIALQYDQFLAVSLSAGFKKYIADYSSIDPTDPSFRNNIQETKPNLGFGILYYSDSFYLGLSVPQLTITGLGTASIQDNNNFESHYYLSGAFITDLGYDFKMKPAGMVSYAKGIPVTFDASDMLYIKDVLGVGLNFRSNYDIAGMISINSASFRLGYSYQFNVSSNTVGGFQNSIQEVSLSFRIGKNLADSKLL